MKEMLVGKRRGEGRLKEDEKVEKVSTSVMLVLYV